VGSTQYFAAWGAAMRGYPLLRGAAPGPGESDPPEVLELMQRVTLIPVARRTLFGPRITIFTKDGRSVTKEGTGREFIWDFEKRRAASGQSVRAPASAMRNWRADRCLPPARRPRRRSPDADFADDSPVSVNAREGRLRCRLLAPSHLRDGDCPAPSFE
jgi:hypothetical protein